MSTAQPGYYADPYGDATKLRYWDGTQWTTACIDNPQAATSVVQPLASQAAAPAQQPAAGPAAATPTAADPAAAVTQAAAAPAQAAAPQPSAAGVAEPAQPDAGAAVPYATAQAPVVPAQPYAAAQPPVAPAPPTAQPASYAAPASGTDTTLRLVAFVFMLVSLVSICIATVLFLPYVIMLAWVIPMTVRSWGIYKGTKRNTVAFGVCSLLFVSIVSGILLLVAKKDA